MKKVIIFLFIISIRINSNAQSEIFQKVYSEGQILIQMLPSKVDNEEKGRDYRRKLDDFSEIIEVSLKSGSGLTFDERNDIKTLQKQINAINNFVTGAHPSSMGYLTEKTIRLTKEIFSNIEITSLTNISSPCIQIFKLTFGDYLIILAKHNNNKSIYKVSYETIPRTKMATRYKGNFGITGGVYRKFWDNSNDKTERNPNLKITSCEFQTSSDFEIFKIEN